MSLSLSQTTPNYIKLFFFNWSAIETGPTFVALPITGGRCVGSVTLDGRWVEGQRVFKNFLVIRQEMECKGPIMDDRIKGHVYIILKLETRISVSFVKWPVK